MECASLCSLTSQCTAFSFDGGNQTCDLANAETMVVASEKTTAALDFYIDASFAGERGLEIS